MPYANKSAITTVMASENRPMVVIPIDVDGNPVQTVGATTYTDRSGTITAGGTAQTIAPLNAARKGFTFQNVSTTDLWLNTMATAVQSQPSFKIAAGMLYETPPGQAPSGAISVIGATTGQGFSCREY